MCGICGIVNIDPARGVDPARLGGMLARLAHRGPDGEGTVAVRGGALGHRRLAIIDLSDQAAQPLPNEDGTVLSIVNGEIYNHHALRTQLEAKGHRFRSRSDCEVLVHLYEEEGIAAAGRLEGMFAFALWDARRDVLVLGRDRMGEKPLYYRDGAEGIAFASEIGALLADPDVTTGPDVEALEEFLTFRYVPSPRTGLAGILKLPPGHVLVWKRGERKVERYAGPPRSAEARARLEAEGALEPGETITPARVREWVGRAVASRLESDVPLGILLSGGLDSAIVAYEASRSARGQLKTFTVGFAESEYDESGRGADYAAWLGTDHHAIRVNPDLSEELPRMIAAYGEPFGDSSAAAVWSLAREVRRHVTVAIGGDGGDELFGGYDRYRAVRLSSWLQRTGAVSAVPFAMKVASMMGFTRSRRDRMTRLERFLRGARQAPRAANGRWLSCFLEDEDRDLRGPALLPAGPEHHARGSRGALDRLARWYDGTSEPLEDVFYADLCMSLPDDLLFKVDIAAMASGLEVRSPFLDTALVDLAMAIPVHDKLGARTGKKILRRAYASVLPAQTWTARKAGFGLPVDRWLRGPLRTMTHDLLLSGRCVSGGYLRAPALARLLREHDEGAANHDDRIWALLCLELWLRVVVEGRGSARWGEAPGLAGAERSNDRRAPAAEGSLAIGTSNRSATGPTDPHAAEGAQPGSGGVPVPERSVAVGQ